MTNAIPRRFELSEVGHLKEFLLIALLLGVAYWQSSKHTVRSTAIAVGCTLLALFIFVSKVLHFIFVVSVPLVFIIAIAIAVVFWMNSRRSKQEEVG